MNDFESHDKKNVAEEKKDNDKNQIIPPITTTNPTNGKKCEKISNCCKYKVNWEQKICEKLKKFNEHMTHSWITALATIGILCVTWIYTHRAGQQVDEMKKAVDISVKTLISSKYQNKLEQRAWLSIQSVKLRNELKANEQNYIDFDIANTGKTPALKVKIKSKAFMQSQLQPDSTIKLEAVPGEGAHGPNSQYKMSSIIIPLTQAEIDDFQSGEKIFSFNVEITYIDIFDDKIIHHTTHCGFYNRFSKREFCLCDYGNNMD